MTLDPVVVAAYVVVNNAETTLLSEPRSLRVLLEAMDVVLAAGLPKRTAYIEALTPFKRAMLAALEDTVADLKVRRARSEPEAWARRRLERGARRCPRRSPADDRLLRGGMRGRSSAGQGGLVAAPGQPTTDEVADRWNETAGEHQLVDEDVRATVRGPVQIGVFGVGADEDHLGLGQFFPDMPRQLHPVEVRHHQVRDHDIWPLAADERERRFPIGGLTDDDDRVGNGCKQRTNDQAIIWIVVNEDDG
jgi:hypothetical protein